MKDPPLVVENKWLTLNQRKDIDACGQNQAARPEEEAISVALSENIPAESPDDLEREIIRIVQTKERVYVSLSLIPGKH